MDRTRPLKVASRALRTARRGPSIHGHTRCIHSSVTNRATPIPFPTVAAPPPPPPSAEASTTEDRVARKRKQAELMLKGLSGRGAAAKDKGKTGAVLQKRFWKNVTVREGQDGYEVYLDSRPVRTASKQTLSIPRSKAALAAAIALEWDLLVTAQQALRQHYIPLTSLTARALDIRAADAAGTTKIRDDIVTMVMKYLNTDTLLCWAEERNNYTGQMEWRTEGGESLRAMQERVAGPIIAYLTRVVWPGVEIRPVLEEGSILPTPQPEMTQAVVKGWVYGLSAFDLAGLERAVLASKSLLVSVRLLVEWSEAFADLRAAEGEREERFSVDEAAKASTLEVAWQTSMWGEVDDTHDVDKEDLRRQLGSVVLLVSGNGA